MQCQVWKDVLIAVVRSYQSFYQQLQISTVDYSVKFRIKPCVASYLEKKKVSTHTAQELNTLYYSIVLRAFFLLYWQVGFRCASALDTSQFFNCCMGVWNCSTGFCMWQPTAPTLNFTHSFLTTFCIQTHSFFFLFFYSESPAVHISLCKVLCSVNTQNTQMIEVFSFDFVQLYLLFIESSYTTDY